jgi:hypothetical protein
MAPTVNSAPSLATKRCPALFSGVGVGMKRSAGY